MLVVCTLLLLGGYLFKAQCNGDWSTGKQYRTGCYNDLKPLYGIRGMSEDRFPYVDARLDAGELVDGGIEYPVLTGVFMWIVGLPVSDVDSYVLLSAVALAPFGLLAAFLLARWAGRRALLWAAAPALVLYAFHNWDLLVVAATVAGLWSWRQGRSTTAAVLFGVGAALKMYPLMFLLPLALERWFAHDRKGARLSLAAGVATVVLVNLPFVLVNPSGWWATYEFHKLRTPNFDTIWSSMPGFVPDFTPDGLNLVTLTLTVITLGAVLVAAQRRAKADGVFPFLQTCAAFLAAFMLWNKVHSPQYTLWLLPFFVLVRVHVAWWVAYALADLAVYFGVFRFFYDFTGPTPGADPMWRDLMVTGVWVRAALLAALCVVFMRARGDEARATVSSHPPARVAPTG